MNSEPDSFDDAWPKADSPIDCLPDSLDSRPVTIPPIDGETDPDDQPPKPVSTSAMGPQNVSPIRHGDEVGYNHVNMNYISV